MTSMPIPRRASTERSTMSFAPFVAISVGCRYPPLIGAMGRRFDKRRSFGHCHPLARRRWRHLGDAERQRGVGACLRLAYDVRHPRSPRGGRHCVGRRSRRSPAALGHQTLAARADHTDLAVPAPLPLHRSHRARLLHAACLLQRLRHRSPGHSCAHRAGRWFERRRSAVLRMAPQRRRSMGQYRTGYYLVFAGLATWLVSGGSYPCSS